MEHRQVSIAGKSQKMKNVYTIVDKVAPTGVNILISGESGCGKETLARYIHEQSRRTGAFEFMNPSIFSSCMHDEAEFGSVLRGYFLKARDGTLLIDDISYASDTLQELMLGIFCEQDALISSDIDYLNVRIVGATSRNLRDLARQKRFRHSICDRFVVNIPLPPLRERRDDIPLLCDLLLSGGANKNTLSKDALDMLITYDWPGNVRELENVLLHAAIMADSNAEVTTAHLPQKLRRKNAFSTKATVADELYKFAKGLMESAQHSEQTDPYAEYLKHIETPLLKAAMDMCVGNKSAASKLLGINRNTLSKKLTDYEIE